MISIFASELSACVGLNKYKPVEEIAITIWNRVDKNSYLKALERNFLIEKPTIEEQIKGLHIKERIFDTIKSENYVSELQTLLLELDDNIDEETKNKLRSFVFTERGKDAEDLSLDSAEIQLGKNIKERNSKFYKKYFNDAGNEVVNTNTEKSFLLGGKVDGITDDGMLVEMKNRQYRLFSTIPVYEKIQIHAYMFLTDISECQFIQCFKDKSDCKIVKFDNLFWDSVKEKLVDFVKALKMILANEVAQDELLQKKVFNLYN